MSQIALCLVDHETEWWGDPHASLVDAVLGALAAEPETLGELETAMQRFARPGETRVLEHWRGKQRNLEQGYDAGLCIVHLPARMIACRSTYSTVSREGSVWCGTREEDNLDLWVDYHLPDDWTLIDDIDHWRGHAKDLAEERVSQPPLDARPVLYDRVCEFIVRECCSARNDNVGIWSPPDGWELRELSHRLKDGRQPTAADAIAEIHARWLMTPRDDLRGQSPREVLQAKRNFIGQDLQSRANQWSVQGECPPPLDIESHAYRYAGFGTHEFLVYYDLVRELVCECWERVIGPLRRELDEAALGDEFHAVEQAADPAPSIQGNAGATPSSQEARPDFDPQAEIAHLRAQKDRWLETPNFEDLLGEVPRDVIEWERRRIPATGSPHDHMIDHDCPLCQMMADMPGPMFWHLDGCNNDDDFPFSVFLDTYEDWEKEQRDYEEFSRQCDERRRLREAGLLEEDPFAADGPWRQSDSNLPESETPRSIRLFGIGSHLAELIQDLKDAETSTALVDGLNRCFGNLRDVVENNTDALLEPSVGRMCDELGRASDVRPDLAEKCADLARQVQRLTSEFGEDHSIPF